MRQVITKSLAVVALSVLWSAGVSWAQVEPAVGPAVEPSVSGSTDAVSSADSLRIAVVSDLNERYGDQYHRKVVHAAVARILESEPDIVLVTGDMVAGQRPGLDYEGMWSAFHAAVTARLTSVPLAIAGGNHDASAYERYAEERAEFAEQWRDAENLADYAELEVVDGSSYPFRYSFAVGPVFFVALDATNRGALGSEQLAWLEGQLTSTSAAEHPVRIVFGHFPLYPIAHDRERDYLLGDEETRERVERLFVEQGVAAYISGHHHAYYPGRHPEHGFRLVGVGCLGGGPRVLLGDDRVIEDLDDPRERSFVLIDVADGAIASVEAYRGPWFTPEDRVDRAQLPEQVGLSSLPISRDDL